MASSRVALPRPCKRVARQEGLVRGNRSLGDDACRRGRRRARERKRDETMKHPQIPLDRSIKRARPSAAPAGSVVPVERPRRFRRRRIRGSAPGCSAQKGSTGPRRSPGELLLGLSREHRKGIVGTARHCHCRVASASISWSRKFGWRLEVADAALIAEARQAARPWRSPRSCRRSRRLVRAGERCRRPRRAPARSGRPAAASCGATARRC